MGKNNSNNNMDGGDGRLSGELDSIASVMVDDEYLGEGDLAANRTTATTTTISSADQSYRDNASEQPVDFMIQYGKVNNMTMYETVAKLENVSSIISKQ